MRRMIGIGASVLMLGGCGSGSEPVGENSAGSVKTTAVGEVVINSAVPAPSPVTAGGDAPMSNDTSQASGMDATAADNTM